MNEDNLASFCCMFLYLIYKHHAECLIKVSSGKIPSSPSPNIHSLRVIQLPCISPPHTCVHHTKHGLVTAYKCGAKVHRIIIIILHTWSVALVL